MTNNNMEISDKSHLPYDFAVLSSSGDGYHSDNSMCVTIEKILEDSNLKGLHIIDNDTCDCNKLEFGNPGDITVNRIRELLDESSCIFGVFTENCSTLLIHAVAEKLKCQDFPFIPVFPNKTAQKDIIHQYKNSNRSLSFLDNIICLYLDEDEFFRKLLKTMRGKRGELSNDYQCRKIPKSGSQSSHSGNAPNDQLLHNLQPTSNYHSGAEIAAIQQKQQHMLVGLNHPAATGNCNGLETSAEPQNLSPPAGAAASLPDGTQHDPHNSSSPDEEDDQSLYLSTAAVIQHNECVHLPSAGVGQDCTAGDHVVGPVKGELVKKRHVFFSNGKD